MINFIHNNVQYFIPEEIYILPGDQRYSAMFNSLFSIVKSYQQDFDDNSNAEINLAGERIISIFSFYENDLYRGYLFAEDLLELNYLNKEQYQKLKVFI